MRAPQEKNGSGAGGPFVAVKGKAGTTAINRTQGGAKGRPGMTLRLPLDLREAITEESRVKGDLARIVLFAMSHINRDGLVIQKTRKARLGLSSPQLLHVGSQARALLKEWAEEEGVSINAIVVSVLEEFFKHLKRSKALQDASTLEPRAPRGFTTK
jgi:hypothetical protein